MDLEKWKKQQGDQVKPSYVRGLIKNFRDTNEFPKALEASQWMCEQKVFNVIPEDYATRVYLVETVLGMEEAERLFESIPENMKDYSVYNTLLRSYTRSGKTLDKAESTFEKMRDLGLLLKPSPFDAMISLYCQLNKQDMVKKLQREKNLLSLVKIKVTEKSKTAGSIENEIEMYGNVPGNKSEEMVESIRKKKTENESFISPNMKVLLASNFFDLVYIFCGSNE